MKRLPMLMLVASLVGTPAAFAAEKSDQLENKKPAPRKAVLTDAEGREVRPAVVTGSMIPRFVRFRGPQTDTPSPMTIVTRKEIETSGATSIAQLLQRF